MKVEFALRKVKHMYGRHYGGYLTPVEIIAIVETGDALCNENDTMNARKRKASGDSVPRWFYFDAKPDSTLEKMLLEDKPSRSKK